MRKLMRILRKAGYTWRICGGTIRTRVNQQNHCPLTAALLFEQGMSIHPSKALLTANRLGIVRDEAKRIIDSADHHLNKSNASYLGYTKWNRSTRRTLLSLVN